MQKWTIDEVFGVYVFEIDRHEDERGYFQELYSTARNYPHLIGSDRQINFSLSHQNVVRGLHVAPFAKLCTCLRGRLYDVIADVRSGSPTYLKHYGIWLDENSRKQVFVPAGCAHGFFSAEANTILLYLQDGNYNPKIEQTINWRDSSLGIKWPAASNYILSERDLAADFINPIS